MYSNILIKGQILKVLEKEFEGKKSYSLQFMTADAKKGFLILSVKVDIEFFNNEIKDNSNVEVPVRVVAVNQNLYYSATDKVKLLSK